MIYDEFVTDMAVDNLENLSLDSVAVKKRLQYGIAQTVINVKNNELAEKLNRPKGVYVTLDVSLSLSERGEKYLAGVISATILQLAGILPYGAVILVVGLGNQNVGADALGAETVSGVISTRLSLPDSTRKYKVCTFNAGVSGVTGIKSVETITALCDAVKPSCVVLVDTLATANAKRVGTSYQLTTSGIAPGSGVGKDKARIDRSVLGVPTIAIGVPLVLSMRTLIGEFMKTYVTDTDSEVDEFKMTSILSDLRLGALIVSPKEIGMLVKQSASVVSKAINTAFN